MEIWASSEAMILSIPFKSRATHKAVRLDSVEPGVRCPPFIPKYGHNQSMAFASKPRATGEIAGCSRFWFSEAFQSDIIHVIQGVGGSMCANASGSSNLVAFPIAIGARHSIVFFSPNPFSGKSSGIVSGVENLNSSLYGSNPSSNSEYSGLNELSIIIFLVTFVP